MITDDQIRDLMADTDTDLPDEIYQHFTEKEEQWDDWVCAELEAVRLYNIVMNTEVEAGSVLSTLFSASAASSWSLAIAQIANALGVSRTDLHDLAITKQNDATAKEKVLKQILANEK